MQDPRPKNRSNQYSEFSRKFLRRIVFRRGQFFFLTCGKLFENCVFNFFSLFPLIEAKVILPANFDDQNNRTKYFFFNLRKVDNSNK